MCFDPKRMSNTTEHAASAAEEPSGASSPSARAAAPDKQRREAEAHLARCGKCRLELASLGWLLADDGDDGGHRIDAAVEEP